MNNKELLTVRDLAVDYAIPESSQRMFRQQKGFHPGTVAASLRRTSAWWCRPVACAALASVSVSALPHERLVAIDARMREAAARPVIVPDQVVIDHGKVFVSDTFVRACDRLGISVQPARKDTPTDKGVVEATFTAIKTLFAQHVAGFKGANPTMCGRGIEAAWTHVHPGRARAGAAGCR